MSNKSITKMVWAKSQTLIEQTRDLVARSRERIAARVFELQDLDITPPEAFLVDLSEDILSPVTDRLLAAAGHLDLVAEAVDAPRYFRQNGGIKATINMYAQSELKRRSATAVQVDVIGIIRRRAVELTPYVLMAETVDRERRVRALRNLQNVEPAHEHLAVDGEQSAA